MDHEDLVKIIRTYDSSFDAEAVRDALKQDHAFAEWAATHLTTETLLTGDELNQFAALENAGSANQLAASVDLATVQAFNDQEIRDAIIELNRSTDAINKQAETLKHQQDALARLVKGTAKDAEDRLALDMKYAQTAELDRKSAVSHLSNLTYGIEQKLSDLKQRGSGDLEAIQETANAMLTSDDKLLKSLQKLGWELETEDPEEKDMVDRLRDVGGRLIKCMVEGVRTRLDRVYLETLKKASHADGTHQRQHGEDVATVQGELEALYTDILDVAHISISQQYLDPALKGVATKNGRGLAKSAKAVEYIDDCLESLLEKTETFCARVEAFQAHQTASSQLTAIAKTELAAHVELPSKKERRPTVGASPTRQQSSPLRGRGTSTSKHRRRSSIIGLLVDESPFEQLLRTLALPLPGDQPTSTNHAQALATALSDRTTKVTDVAANVQDSFEAATTAQLRDSALAVQLLRDSLLAESPFGRVNLVDPEMDVSIRVLDQELERVRRRMEEVETEVRMLKGRRGKQEELIRRWGDA